MFDVALLLWPFFWLGFIATVLYGFSLLYHWIRFGNMYPLVWIALPVYVLGSLLFIGAMLAAIASV